MAAVASINYDGNQIIFSSRLFFYGSEANTMIADAIVEEITRMYNEPKATAFRNGRLFDVIFEISYELVSPAEALERSLTNSNFQNNFIRIETENTTTRSFMGFGLGDNTGHWILSDNLGESTTAAHEFGHSLGLDHPANPDFRGSASPPPIMAARGSLVDAHYQWNPLAKAGEYGGTMNPKYRKVSKAEIEELLEGLSFNSTETYYIGYLSNKLFDKKGYVLGGLA